jgi:hypothetical protein
MNNKVQDLSNMEDTKTTYRPTLEAIQAAAKKVRRDRICNTFN